MEPGPSKKDQKATLDNFASLDVEILSMQNKNLMAEVLRLRQASAPDDLKNQAQMHRDSASQHVRQTSKEAVSQFLRAFEAFAVKSNVKWTYSLYEVVHKGLQ